MKKAAIISVILGLIAVIFGVAAFIGEKSSLGIIGGADGPTAVFVVGNFGGWAVPLTVGVILLLVAFFLYRKRKH